MSYIIYKNLDEKTFDSLKDQLNTIEPISSAFMQQSDFYFNRKSYSDVLALDYLNNRGSFHGNIGLRYSDNPALNAVNQFEFYVLKAMDNDYERFYKRILFPEKYSLDIIYGNVYSFFGDCLSLYKSIKEEDLTEKSTLRK